MATGLPLLGLVPQTTARDLPQLAREMRLAGESGEAVPADAILHWVAVLEALLPSASNPTSASGEASPPRATSASAGRPATSATPAARRAPSAFSQQNGNEWEKEACGLGAVADHGRLEVRKLSTKPLLSSKSLHSVTLCVYAILRSTLRQVDGSSVALYVPHRGSDSEFRLLYQLLRSASGKRTGSTILRGSSLMECACMRTGYVVNIAPKTTFSMHGDEKQQSAKPAQQDQQTFRDSEVAPESNAKTPAPARMCCPVKASTVAAPVGVISVVGRSTLAFDHDAENFTFDAALLVADLLQGCEDVVALQKCFAQGDFQDVLPPLPEAVVVPSRDAQLVYRANEQRPNLADCVRVVGRSGAVEHVREGMPILSVFQHMAQIQKAWISSVKLNIELKAEKDKQELQLANVRSQLADAVRRAQSYPSQRPQSQTHADGKTTV